ncbi:hypothetical protein LZ198_21625 [Myxococcus sp. K15C18031901]|uniref:hypothetical protein n=1 Tax=Myxococcus dinghuensis TaxID=2906761 RepID=UPI0020A7218F|nr:hypothetical protein [Myxococcus dinghuensis]MCP3101479.1 hypothetical protein [Myxococcus dinghuensis]
MRSSSKPWSCLCVVLVGVSLGGCDAPPQQSRGEDGEGESRGAAVDFAVGISDSDPDTFTHPAWSGLNVRRARAVVPYDVAQRPTTDSRRQTFEAWLQATAAQGVEPYVTLGPSDRYKVASGKYLAPTDVEYRAAFEAFHAAYPAVTLVGAWNEPNFPNTVLQSGVPLDQAACDSEDLERCGPLRAAFYYRLVVSLCPECTVVAGEFDATPNDPYWDRYRVFLRSHRPKLWSVHTHHDANRYQSGGHHCVPGDMSCTTRTFVNWLGGLDSSWDVGHIWLTEVGAFYRNADGQVFGDASQRDTAKFILRLPNLSARITRVYYYNYANRCSTAATCAMQDRGIIAPEPLDGSPLSYDTAGRLRPAYAVIRDRDTNGP